MIYDINWIAKSIRWDVCYNTDDVAQGTDVVESKMAREMLCFIIETAAVGREGRICKTAVAGYVRGKVALAAK